MCVHFTKKCRIAPCTGGAVCRAVQGDAGDALRPRPATLPVHPREAGAHGLADAVCTEAVSWWAHSSASPSPVQQSAAAPALLHSMSTRVSQQANEVKAKKEAERKARKEAERKEREAAKAKKAAAEKAAAELAIANPTETKPADGGAAAGAGSLSPMQLHGICRQLQHGLFPVVGMCYLMMCSFYHRRLGQGRWRRCRSNGWGCCCKAKYFCKARRRKGCHERRRHG